MTKLKGILLTQGMHGMISQVEGLAKALDIDFTHHTVELNNFWKMVPPKVTPISQSVYKKIDHENFDVIISCGRKSVIPSIHLKNTANKKVFNIHIQDPKVDLNHFDFIVAPEHDALDGQNVLNTKGAIHYNCMIISKKFSSIMDSICWCSHRWNYHKLKIMFF